MLLCRLFGHDRQLSKVWHDGVDLRAKCKRCAVPMIRDVKLGSWRELSPEDGKKHLATLYKGREALPRG